MAAKIRICLAIKKALLKVIKVLAMLIKGGFTDDQIRFIGALKTLIILLDSRYGDRYAY